MDMHMDRRRCHVRVNDLIDLHVKALRGQTSDPKVAEALDNAKIDFHAMIDEIFNELDAIKQQEQINKEAGIDPSRG